MSSNFGFDICKELSINLCLYCNNEKIFIKEGRKKVRPDLDHFYPQSKYPFLALTLSNLIPTGDNCNRRYKSAHNMLNHLHPYIGGIGNNKLFHINHAAGEYLTTENVIISIIRQRSIIDNNIEMFELDTIYNNDEELLMWLEDTNSRLEFLMSANGDFQHHFINNADYRSFVNLSKEPHRITAQKFKIDAINQFTGKRLTLPYN